MKKLTREERRRRSQRRLQLITYLLFLILLLAWLGSYLIMTVEAEPPTLHKMAPAAEDGSLPGDDTPATTRCYLTGEEMEAAENELIEAAWPGLTSWKVPPSPFIVARNGLTSAGLGQASPPADGA